MAGNKDANVRTPHEIDPDLAAFVYGERGDELSSFFFRRAGNAENAAALLAETFATAAQLRTKRNDRSASDSEWIYSIAHLELSRFLRCGTPSRKAVSALSMTIPQLTVVDVTHDITAMAA